MIEMKHTHGGITLSIVLALSSALALAQPADSNDRRSEGTSAPRKEAHAHPQGQSADAVDTDDQTADRMPMSLGVIRKIDSEARTLTIKHGPISNLGMPPMTMIFQTDENLAIEEFEVGDTVKFHVIDRKGRMTIIRIEAAP